MSAHALVWLALFVGFGALSLRRSSWAIPMYIMTFYASPNLWWWGGVLKSMGSRWSLVAALFLLISALVDSRPKLPSPSPTAKKVLLLLSCYAVNASVVHFAFAVEPIRSWEWLDLLWKQVVLLAVMQLSIRDEFDLKLLVYTIVFGGAFIGAEVVFFDAGHMAKGRLEGIKLPAGSEANHLAALLIMSAILAGFFVLFGSLKERVVALVCSALLAETVLQCISRGVTLAAICGGAWLVVGTRGKARRYAVLAAIAAIGGALAIMGPQHQERFFVRFMTTFVKTEDLDISAAGRLEFWESGCRMINDHPFGYGGDAFKTEWARSRYLPESDRPRSLENGYLDTTVCWGVQGFLLYMPTFVLCFFAIRRGILAAESTNNMSAVFLGVCIQSMIVTHLAASCFNSIMKSEMCFWLLALSLAYNRVYDIPQEEGTDSDSRLIK